MHLYFKAVQAYAERVFFPDSEDKDSYRSNVFKRYAYYTMDDLMIVDDAIGKYVRCPMPMPFSIPGKLYWHLLYIWQVKIRKTHV